MYSSCGELPMKRGVRAGGLVQVLCLFLLVALLEGTVPVKKLLRENPEQDIYPLLQVDDMDEWVSGFDLSLAHRAFHLLDPLDEVVQIHIVLAGFDDLSLSAVGARLAIRSFEPSLMRLRSSSLE